MCGYEKDFNIKAEWHFFPSPRSGIGCSIIRTAKDASIRKTAKMPSTFSIPRHVKKLNANLKKGWEFIYATDEDYSDAEDILQEKFCNLITIPGTKKSLAYIPRDKQSVYASE